MIYFNQLFIKVIVSGFIAGTFAGRKIKNDKPKHLFGFLYNRSKRQREVEERTGSSLNIKE